MNPHNRKPLFYKSVNPGLSEVGEVASGLFQWDETNNKPTEVGQGKSFMPPQEIEGEYVIWSDTYTLGYTIQSESAPIFFSDGGAGDAKILQMINTVSFRLGEGVFDDVASAKAWALSESRIYVAGSTASGGSLVCDPNVSMPVLGAPGPGGLNLYFIATATKYFTGTANGSSLGTFDTVNMTKTYACTLEFFKSTTQIGSAGWFGYSDGIYTSTAIPGSYAMLQAGDVIYRDPAGNNYFPENHGFILNAPLNTGATIRDRMYWVAVGANGVVTSVDKMTDL